MVSENTSYWFRGGERMMTSRGGIMFVYHIKIFQVIVDVFGNKWIGTPKTSKGNGRRKHRSF